MEDSKETRTPFEAVIPSSPLTGTDSGLKIRCPPKQDRCAFFLKRKLRFCTVPRLPTSKWCGNHQHLEAGYENCAAAARSKTQEKRGGQRRVPCPLDSKHTVYERELSAHLRVCNVKREQKFLEDKPFYRRSINSGSLRRPGLNPQPLDVDEVPAILARIRGLQHQKESHPRGEEVEQITSGPVAEKILATMVAKNWTSESKERHLVQQASLISHLHRRGLLGARSTCVELGAGRGTLGHAVHQAFPEARVVLVERAGVRLKADAPYRRTGEGGVFARYRLDIRDLWINGLPLGPGGLTSPLAFMGKHVCGAATDLSLRAVADYVRDFGGSKEEGAAGEGTCEQGPRLGEGATMVGQDEKGSPRAQNASKGRRRARIGLVIATCCYHVCRYEDYVGVEAWENDLGLGREEFEVAQRSACWVSSLTSARGHRYKPRIREEGKAGRESYADSCEKEETGAGGEGDVEVDRGVRGQREETVRRTSGDAGGEQVGARRQAKMDVAYTSLGKGLSRDQKIQIGRACKRLIDYGRLAYLRASGLEAECLLYCEPDVSPENSCILAWTPIDEEEAEIFRDGER